jgi:CRP/FNR family cyclic AMP-dependent transcriptional regulator
MFDEKKRLAGSTLFCGLDDTQLSAVLELAHMEMFEAEEVIFRQGDPGGSLYVVLEGRVRISMSTPSGGEEALAVLKEGASFGEMTAIRREDEPRSTAAITCDETVLRVFDREPFRELLERDAEIGRQILWNLVQDLSGHLRAANEKLIFLTQVSQF